MTKLNWQTLKALYDRRFGSLSLARILDCSEQHAADLLSGYVEPRACERAVMRLCANVTPTRLAMILGDLAEDYEWRRIPDYERYEVSAKGQVRRAVAGHGSMAGHVLRPKRSATGHLYVKIAPYGKRIRTVAVHQAVCAAFNGPRPSPLHMVCHRNDVPDDNRPENLYWGTSWSNAQDRLRNSTTMTQDVDTEDKELMRRIRKKHKESMLYRLRKQAENIA